MKEFTKQRTSNFGVTSWSTKTWLEVRLSNKSPIRTADGNEIELAVPPSRYVVKREELRRAIELGCRYAFCFQLGKGVYGVGHVVHVKPEHHKQESLLVV